MHGWVECVPNFSDGQNEGLIAHLESVVRRVPGVVFLRSDPNPDQNRTLFTFAGPGHSVRRAAFDLIQGALEKIDLNRHIGAHPRMGAVDVVPFVPLGTTTMEMASELARELSEEVGTRLQIPVFLYEESATSAERRSLAAIRKGGFEGHRANGYPVGPPDFGPSQPHATFGTVAIGARFFIIAFNLILDTNDLEIARTVARVVRESSRGLPAVRALGLPLASQGLVQVAINILDYRLTSMTQVMEKAREEARRLGTSILESELIGLVPRAAIADSVWELLRLPPRRRERVVEDAVENSGMFSFSERLAAATPTPGGGAAAARSGLHATCLIRMVTGLALERLKGSGTGSKARLSEIRDGAAGLGKEYRALEAEDEESFDRLLSATRKARASGAKGTQEKEAVGAAALTATEVPLRMLEAGKRIYDLLEGILELQKRGEISLRAGSDLVGAVELCLAASRMAEVNIRVNLPQLPSSMAEECGKRCVDLIGEIERRHQALRDEILRLFAPGGSTR